MALEFLVPAITTQIAADDAKNIKHLLLTRGERREGLSSVHRIPIYHRQDNQVVRGTKKIVKGSFIFFRKHEFVGVG